MRSLKTKLPSSLALYMSNFPLNIIYTLVQIYRNSSHFPYVFMSYSLFYRAERTRIVSHSSEKIKDSSSSGAKESSRKLRIKDKNEIICTESQESQTQRQRFRINAVNKIEERNPEPSRSQLYWNFSAINKSLGRIHTKKKSKDLLYKKFFSKQSGALPRHYKTGSTSSPKKFVSSRKQGYGKGLSASSTDINKRSIRLERGLSTKSCSLTQKFEKSLKTNTPCKVQISAISTCPDSDLISTKHPITTSKFKPQRSKPPKTSKIPSKSTKPPSIPHKSLPKSYTLKVKSLQNHLKSNHFP
ncbi:unnamed protein product [Moneuplotes crassus]|uniref:Uncharacterized protein n=1 Tax=Euplotes crassus TaxID=5936 RepID=A0AAD1XHT1_EUPCR|nr:unnamed protein product [Moneuplotes crassus]